jgi:hypothetical protein
MNFAKNNPKKRGSIFNTDSQMEKEHFISQFWQSTLSQVSAGLRYFLEEYIILSPHQVQNVAPFIERHILNNVYEAGGSGSCGGNMSEGGATGAGFFLRRSRTGTTTAMAMKKIDRHSGTMPTQPGKYP